MSPSSRQYVFLDRDGTILVECNYFCDFRQVELVRGAAKGLQKMKGLGLGLVVVTNQSGVGRGYFGLKELEAVHQRMNDLLAAEGVFLDGIFYCPHTPEDDCNCRKPSPGMIQQAYRHSPFSFVESYIVGDKICDLELGKNAGISTILVRTGYGRNTEKELKTKNIKLPVQFIAEDLLDAALYIEQRLNYSEG